MVGSGPREPLVEARKTLAMLSRTPIGRPARAVARDPGRWRRSGVAVDPGGAHDQIVHPDLVRGAAEALPADEDGVEHAAHPVGRLAWRRVRPIGSLSDGVDQ